MTDKKETKKELEERVTELEAKLTEQHEQLVAVSEGYQNMVNANNALNGLVIIVYERNKIMRYM